MVDRPKKVPTVRPSAANEQRDAHERLMPVRRHLEGFGCTVGIHDGKLVVGDRELTVPRFVGSDAVERAIDAVVGNHFTDRLFRTVDAQLHDRPPGIETSFNHRVGAVDLRDRGRLVARVSATRWWKDPGRGPSGAGNFVTRGDQWDALRDHVVGESPATGSGASMVDAVGRLRLDPSLPMRYAFSDGLQPQLAAIGVAASRRIRTERSLAFGHVVHVQASSGFEVAFSAVLHDRGRPEMAVIYQDARGRVPMRMRVAGRSDPLAVRAPTTISSSRVDRAWVCALLVFAELTCPPDLEHLRPASPAKAPSKHPGRSGISSRSTAAERRRPAPRRTATERTFEPIGETSRWISSYVVGHRRLLPRGHTPSDDAITAATAAGITLRSGETWVSPHVRGMPPDIALHFSWKAPSAFGVVRNPAADRGNFRRPSN